jgi:transketolase
MTISEMQDKCKAIRRIVINMLTDSGSGHPGGSLSVVEIMVALYYKTMRINPSNPKAADRDRFVLSKGHAAPTYYAILGDKGFFSKEEFKNFRQLHSMLQGHPDSKKCPGIDASTGSLGQGISIAVGMALGAKLAKKDVNVYVICGDGELQEGLVWEASMAAAHYKLDNLTVIVDNNGIQLDGTNDQVMNLGNLNAKFSAFGYQVIDVANGNDVKQVLTALDKPVSGMPKLILCHTVKGKGVSFMENQVSWHGKAPNDNERKLALQELEG